MIRSASLPDNSSTTALAPFLAIGAAVAAAVALVVPGVRVEPVIIGIVAGSYVPALSSLAWTLAPVLALQMSISSYVPGTTVSLRLAAVVLSVVLAAPA